MILFPLNGGTAGLARAGGADADQVIAPEDNGEALRLDGSRPPDALRLQT